MSSIVLESISASPPAIHQNPVQLGYKPALDGLRAFAVLVVMAYHADVPFFAGGGVGVDVFFVLSGFLITSLLLEEWRKTGNISLRRFYIRRILRLIPALAVFLISIQMYSLAFFPRPRLWETEKAIAAVVFYVGNWVRAFGLLNMGVLSHTWSLSIEEQFYMIWPLAFLLLLRTGKKDRWFFRMLLLAIVLIAVRRVAGIWTGISSFQRIYNGSDTRSDELLTGCASAVWLHAATFPRDRARLVLRYFTPVAILLIAGVVVHPLHYRTMYSFGWPAIELAVAVMILAVMLGAAVPLQNVLELAPLVWIGRLSYGLYLWHLPIVSSASGWHFLGPFRWLAGFALTFAAATASYYLVEKRFLKRKQQFASA